MISKHGQFSSQKYLNQFPSKTEIEKAGYLSIGVTGHAARVLAQSSTPINTTIGLFNVLRETFDNQSTIDEAMSDVRQQKGFPHSKNLKGVKLTFFHRNIEFK